LLKFGVRTISFMPYPYEILCVLSGKHALPATRFLDFLPPMTSRFGAKLLSKRIPDQVKLVRDVLEKCQHRRIADGS